MGYDIGWIIPRLRNPGRLWYCASSITVAVVGLFSKIIIEFLNKTTVYNREALSRAARRPRGVPLLTVSNHHSCFDDPGLWVTMTNRLSYAQFEGLVEFLEQNPGIAKGLLKTIQGKAETKKKWAYLATTLNSLGGANKNGQGWAKYWAEKKSALKKQCAELSASMRRTGGGTADNLPALSALENRLVAVMGGQEFATRDSVAVNPFPQWSRPTETPSVHTEDSSLQEDIEMHSIQISPIPGTSHNDAIPASSTSALDSGVLLRNSRMRWSLAAHDICFTNALHSCFFALGKCVPVVRGAGVYQPAMDFCVERLSRGDWVHIFPEGRVNVNKEHIRFKWGVGRLVADCAAPPLIVPVWHEGMDRVLPNQEPYLLKFRKRVFLNVGEPIQIHHLLDKLRSANASEEETRKAITERIQDELLRLRERTHALIRRAAPAHAHELFDNRAAAERGDTANGRDKRERDHET